MSDTPEHEKPVAFKITHGYVRQDFVDGKCVGQEFIAGDPVAWENEVGDAIDCPDNEQYQPFDMVSPGDDVEGMKETIAQYEAEEYDRQQGGE